VSLRTVIVRMTAPIAFFTRGRTAKQLFVFALAEQESMLELRAAAARCTSPERSALYLRHALDEERHATIFATHSAEIRRSLGKPAWGHPRTSCENLYARLGEVGFLAFVHRGEMRGRSQFEVYETYFQKRGDDKLRAMFAALIGDEKGHEAYTKDLLVKQAGRSGASKALAKVVLWEAFRTWRRAGQGMAKWVYTAAMTVLFACLAPFALFVRLMKPARGGWK
jgi:rubrerythrin